MRKSLVPRSSAAPSVRELPQFQRRLLAWFHRRKRDLPWRRTRDPYRIWLSEIMLQQTRVAAVIPYYERFLARFPDVRALAVARPNEVLRFWSGLGYYVRARNLHAAARQIVATNHGRFPRDLNAAISLPGIGDYTAAAVLSIAYNAPLAVLDGNVARVLVRLGALRGDLRAPRRWLQLQQRAQQLLATRASGDWNQAMMELGATVCTPRAPNCNDCPVARWCQARRLGLTEAIPAVRKKRPPLKLTLAAAVLLDSCDHTLLIRPRAGSTADDHALFSRMWQFPALRVRRAANGGAVADLRAHLSTFGIAADVPEQTLSPARHTVTFRDITLQPFLFRVPALPRPSANGSSHHSSRIVPLASLTRLAVSNATRKIAASALVAIAD